jgi:hypothetical protein
MTDARLMDADCIHGILWWSCADCCAYLDEPVRKPMSLDPRWPRLLLAARNLLAQRIPKTSSFVAAPLNGFVDAVGAFDADTPGPAWLPGDADVNPGLPAALRWLGEEYGPLEVAIAAVDLTDGVTDERLVLRPDRPEPEPDVRLGWATRPTSGTYTIQDSAGAEVGRITYGDGGALEIGITEPSEPERPTIALRTRGDAGGSAHGLSLDEPLDDVYVDRPTMFRMEDMGDHWWMCCYLDEEGTRIDFRIDGKRVRIRAYSFPRVLADGTPVTYEGDVDDEAGAPSRALPALEEPTSEPTAPA